MGFFDKRLSQASVQELCLEQIRRQNWNAFDGEVVVQDLLEHHILWKSVIAENSFIRVQGSNFLPIVPNLMQLAENDEDLWMLDQIWILAVNEDAAQQLVKIANEQWGGEVHLYDEEQSNIMLMGDAQRCRIVSIWWD